MDELIMFCKENNLRLEIHWEDEVWTVILVGPGRGQSRFVRIQDSSFDFAVRKSMEKAVRQYGLAKRDLR